MLSKVLKNMQKNQKKSAKKTGTSEKKYPTSKLSIDDGFHAKKNSLAGAARQRSMGNRNNKRKRSK